MPPASQRATRRKNADGSPHVTSVGALWHAGSCWFQTGEGTRKAKNVARDPRCTISVATKGFDVMVAGEARRVTDPKIVAEIAALWAKSGCPPSPTTREPASPRRSTRRPSVRRRGSSTKSSRAPRPRSVPPKRRRVQRVGDSEVGAIARTALGRRSSSVWSGETACQACADDRKYVGTRDGDRTDFGSSP